MHFEKVIGFSTLELVDEEDKTFLNYYSCLMNAAYTLKSLSTIGGKRTDLESMGYKSTLHSLVHSSWY